MKTFLKRYLKQLKINREILLSSLKASIGAIIKIFLLHKLQQLKYYKPVMIVLRIILKWSALSSLISIGNTLLGQLLGFNYNLTFIISFLSAIWTIISELSLDSIYHIWEYLINMYNKLLAKMYVRLSNSKSKGSETEERMQRIKNMFARIPEEQKLLNHDEVADYYVEQERMKDPKYQAKIKVKSNANALPFTYHDKIKLVALAGSVMGIIFTGAYSLEQVRGFINTLSGIRNTLRDFFTVGTYFAGFIPESISNLINRFWPFWTR